jgi:hypothetical protein
VLRFGTGHEWSYHDPVAEGTREKGEGASAGLLRLVFVSSDMLIDVLADSQARMLNTKIPNLRNWLSSQWTDDF